MCVAEAGSSREVRCLTSRKGDIDPTSRMFGPKTSRDCIFPVSFPFIPILIWASFSDFAWPVVGEKRLCFRYVRWLSGQSNASRVRDSSRLFQERASIIFFSGRATALVFEPRDHRTGGREYG
jgi:hypothetical protein